MNQQGRNIAEERIIIVGGSLTGLTCALSLARQGVRSLVLERTAAAHRSGGGLGVDRAMLQAVTGLDPRCSGFAPALPVVHSYRESTSWLALHGWLRGNVLHQNLIELCEGAEVTRVSCDQDKAYVEARDGRAYAGSLVIGCDGYKSVVRKEINPGSSETRYAGYMLWRGLVDEREMARDTVWAGKDDTFGFIDRSGYRLIAYPVPGIDGSLRPGERQVSFAWYDAHRDDLLRQTRCLDSDDNVRGTLSSPMIDQQVRNELQEIARSNWPAPWRDVVLHAISGPTLFGTPICEYYPEAVVRGRMAIAGDAAHVASPMTGRGFQTGAEDAAALGHVCGEDQRSGKAIDAGALMKYSANRLPAAQRLARSSIQASREYLDLAQRTGW